MKVIKRENVCGPCTASLWWIPTMTYFFMKINGIVSFHNEWLWWVTIPIMFLIWVLINWKFKI
jgi:hypothetical protein